MKMNGSKNFIRILTYYSDQRGAVHSTSFAQAENFEQLEKFLFSFFLEYLDMTVRVEEGTHLVLHGGQISRVCNFFLK